MSDWEARETRGGKTLTRRLWALLEDAYDAVGLDFSSYDVGQGSWSHAAASAGTHSGNGAVDLRSRLVPTSKIEPLINELRRRGMCAWYRTKADGFDAPHIHAIYRYYRDLAPGARQQVRSYDNGRSGLASNRPDRHRRPPQRPYEPAPARPKRWWWKGDDGDIYSTTDKARVPKDRKVYDSKDDVK